MSTVVIITGSPSAGSGPDALLRVVGNRISHSGHAVIPLVLPDLPPGATADDTNDGIALAVAAVVAADGVVVVWPAQSTGDGGLLDIFSGALPQSALHGKPTLSLLVGSSPEQASALESALRPVLSRLGADPTDPGCLVLEADIRAYPGGGVVLDAGSALPLAEATDAFLAALAGQAPAAPPRATGRVSPVVGSPDLTVVRAEVDDPVLAPLLRDLMIEYSTRYGGPSPYTTLTEVPASDFIAPHGAFLALIEDAETIAGGALRRYDDQTAEVKRVWTSSRHRRRGLALRLMAELEQAALALGYRRIHLTTGRRQPEAVSLYLAAGYVPRFDVTADLGDTGPLAFGKELVPGAGLVDWEEPDDYYGSGTSVDQQPASSNRGMTEAVPRSNCCALP